MHYADQTFSDCEIRLDGNIYERCVFERCHLLFAAQARVHFAGNISFNECRWTFSEAAQYTIEFLGLLSSTPTGKTVVQKTLTAVGIQFTKLSGPLN